MNTNANARTAAEWGSGRMRGVLHEGRGGGGGGEASDAEKSGKSGASGCEKGTRRGASCSVCETRRKG